MRNKLVIGNWKMNFTDTETKNFLSGIKVNIPEGKSKVVVCPSFLSIKTAVEVLEDSNIEVGVQNVYFEPAGAYTGEISVQMLEDIGAKYCIIGHSERRKYFNETDEMVNKKAIALLEKNITPVICVGEDLDIREQGTHLEFVEIQVRKALSGIDIRRIDNIIIAYEPVWAIGTGKAATENEAEEMCSNIRYIIQKMFGKEVSENVSILYGGSVTSSVSEAFISKENIDGFLVGGASLKQDFVEIVKIANMVE